MRNNIDMGKKIILMLLALALLSIAQAQPSKKCKTCGKPLKECKYKGKHPNGRPQTPQPTRQQTQQPPIQQEQQQTPQNNSVVRMDGNDLVFSVDGTEYRYKMIHVDGGSFNMGAQKENKYSTNYDGEAYPDESPVHRVSVSSFYIGQTEVTQALWMAVMHTRKFTWKDDNSLPASSISWYEAQSFISKLNELTGIVFRLPTEAEWEYAARGGKNSKGYKYSGNNNINVVAWYDGNTEDFHPKPVALLRSNELGLYDMSGNEWEWCEDWFSENYYAHSPTLNPTGPATGTMRVRLGGSVGNRSKTCRVSCRSAHDPNDNSSGFRLVMAK